MSSNVINRDPEILGGTPVFRGSRVPIAILFEWLEAGESLGEFLNNYPTVSREQAIELLELAKSGLLSSSEAAA
ncbi:MAG: DUF433 domain-containing protein [Gammaproteobacteria bacterium]